MQVFQITVKPDKQTLRQIDVFCRNDQTQSESTEHEDDNGDTRADEDGFRVIFGGGCFHVHDVDTHHLHTRVEQEDSRCQYEVVEIGQVREETLAHVHVVVSARGDVDDSEDNQ